MDGRPCSGNGGCDELRKGTGQCTCNGSFTGLACERCMPGHYGPTCKRMLHFLHYEILAEIFDSLLLYDVCWSY